MIEISNPDILHTNTLFDTFLLWIPKLVGHSSLPFPGEHFSSTQNETRPCQLKNLFRPVAIQLHDDKKKGGQVVKHFVHDIHDFWAEVHNFRHFYSLAIYVNKMDATYPSGLFSYARTHPSLGIMSSSPTTRSDIAHVKLYFLCFISLFLLDGAASEL